MMFFLEIYYHAEPRGKSAYFKISLNEEKIEDSRIVGFDTDQLRNFIKYVEKVKTQKKL